VQSVRRNVQYFIKSENNGLDFAAVKYNICILYQKLHHIARQASVVAITMCELKHRTCTFHLHEVADVLAVWENLREILGAKDVAEGRLGEQTRGPVRVLDVRDGYRGVRHAVVDDSVDSDRHRVLGQDLQPPAARPSTTGLLVVVGF